MQFKKGEKQMKKIAISGVVLSMFAGAGSAFADVTVNSLTTKNYVYEGLKAVNNKAKTAISTAESALTAAGAAEQKATNALSLIGAASTENTEATGLIGDIESLDADYTNLSNTVNGLSQTVGDANSGLVKGVADNAAAIQANTEAIQNLQNQNMNYSEGDGIEIDATTREISVKGLADTENGKQYVYKNGQLQEIDVVTTWDSSILD